MRVLEGERDKLMHVSDESFVLRRCHAPRESYPQAISGADTRFFYQYHDCHTMSRMIGAAPGYVGFEEGGMRHSCLITPP